MSITDTKAPRALARIGGHPLHAMLVPFPIVCFIGVFLTDLAYWRTLDVMWERFSTWLLAAGLVTAALAALAGLVDFIASRHIRALKVAWMHALGNAAALIIAIFNAGVHTRDAYTAVVPEGMILSGIVVLILLFTIWMGRHMVDHHRVGVTN